MISFQDTRPETMIEQVWRLEMENTTLKARVDELQDQIAGMCEECEYIEGLTRERDSLKKRVESADRSYHRLQREHQEYQWESEDRLDRCQRMNRRFKQGCRL